jgi:hypothetical protein
MALKRSYIADIPGGTATTTVQMQENGTVNQICVSAVNAAAGSYEISTSPSSQIGTAQPDSTVIARVRISGTAGPSIWAVMDGLKIPVRAFQNLYVHCSGAGNLGEVIFM